MQTKREVGVQSDYTSVGHATSFADGPLPILSLLLTTQHMEGVKRVSLSWNLACGAAPGGEPPCVCREA